MVEDIVAMIFALTYLEALFVDLDDRIMADQCSGFIQERKEELEHHADDQANKTQTSFTTHS